MQKIIPEDSVLVPDQAECVFKGMIFDVYQWEQELFDGSKHTFEMLKRADTVNAIAVVDGKILVLDDEQPHLGKRRSLPGGRVDDTDTRLEFAIQRELREETGYSFQNWRLIKVQQSYRKIEWFTYTFLATDVSGQEAPELDPGEKISVELLDFDAFKAAVAEDTDYLGEARDILASVNNLDELQALSEFTGRSVDR